MEALIPDLPDDLSLQCLMRVPSNSYGLLRCVCRSWNALLSASPSMRMEHNLMEDCLHVMARIHGGDYRWIAFDVHQSAWRMLAPMPISSFGGAVAADSRIFFIGGSYSGIASKSVWCYEPSCGRWTEKSRMRISRQFAAAEFIDGRIFVLGGCSPGLWAGSLAWAEVYDPGTDEWSTIQTPREIRQRWMHNSVVLDGKLFAITDSGGLVYDPACNEFSSMSTTLDHGWCGRAAVLNGMLFSLDYLGSLRAYDHRQDAWQQVVCELPGMASTPLLCAASGKLYVIGEHSRRNRTTDLILAALDIQKDEHGLLRGRMLWNKTAACNFAISALIQAVPVKV